jgi:hypothetical protein
MGIEPTTCRRGDRSPVFSRRNGADGGRTHDLLHAMQALSQLSYGPGILCRTDRIITAAPRAGVKSDRS